MKEKKKEISKTFFILLLTKGMLTNDGLNFELLCNILF